MKICKIIFSTNRLEFLLPTLSSCKNNIDWGNHEVDGLFIDDMPKDRNDSQITELANLHGYNNVILHKENKGLGYTWHESYEWLKGKGYDYILHQEDDLVLKSPIKIDDLFNLMKVKSVSGISLKYQDDWYGSWKKIKYEWIKDFPSFNYLSFFELTNFINKQFDLPLIQKSDKYQILFDTSFSLYETNVILESYELAKVAGLGNGEDWIAEGTFASYVHKYLNKKDFVLYIVDKNDNDYIEHIGEWSWGFRSSMKDVINGSYNEFQKNRMVDMINNPYAKINSRTWLDWMDQNKSNSNE